MPQPRAASQTIRPPWHSRPPLVDLKVPANGAGPTFAAPHRPVPPPRSHHILSLSERFGIHSNYMLSNSKARRNRAAMVRGSGPLPESQERLLARQSQSLQTSRTVSRRRPGKREPKTRANFIRGFWWTAKTRTPPIKANPLILLVGVWPASPFQTLFLEQTNLHNDTSRGKKKKRGKRRGERKHA